MLDVQSPSTGAGKGMLIPRVTLTQRTTANASLAGGLLDNSGNLRGGAAQGLIVYQTDGSQGLYFNTSLTAAPTWSYLGDVTGLLSSNVWAAAGSTTNYLPRTGGTMSGALNMGAQIVTNVAYIDFNGDNVSVGRGANSSDHGTVVGRDAHGSVYGAVMGWSANGSESGAAVGSSANGYDHGTAIGSLANGSGFGAAVGQSANGYTYGAAIGYAAIGTNSGAAMGAYANGAQTNVAIGRSANAQGGTERIAIGHQASNTNDNSALIRGTLYLDGGTGVVYRETFGSGSWTAKAFTIDHPLDPENKVLRHFCLEGPQVWNVYAGNAQLVNGMAVVELPDYYSALNLVGSEIYSLTVVDENANQFPLVKVTKKVADNRFVIAGTVDVEVSWTIKVLRNDPGCLEDLLRRPVEQFKRDISN